MNPEDQLRSLRDSSRWTFGELQPRAVSRPPVRRRAWLSLPAVIAEIAVVAIVATAVVGVIGFQNREVPPGPVAIGPTPSASPDSAPDDFLRGRATCTSLLDDETVARLKGLGMTPTEDAAVQVEGALAEYFENGMACTWAGAQQTAISFAYAPLRENRASNARKHLLEAGAVTVDGAPDRLTDPVSATGSYAFGDGYLVYVNSPGEDLMPTIFDRAAMTAIAGSQPEDSSFVSFTPSATWNSSRSELNISSSASGGCEREVQEVELAAPGQIVVHIDYDHMPTACLMNLYNSTRTVPVPDGAGDGEVTVTIIDDFSRHYWSSELH